MFKYRFVVDQATGERYYIARAMLVDSDDGPDLSVDGVNPYEVVLEPYSGDANPIYDVALSVCGGSVWIAQGLSTEKPVNMMPVIVDGETLVVPQTALQLIVNSGAEIDFDRWVPDARDEDGIYRQLHENVLSTVECCGNGSEEAADAVALYAKVMQSGITACKADVQRYFLEMYHAVHGELEKYYKPYTELIALIKLTCGLETRNGSVSNDL